MILVYLIYDTIYNRYKQIGHVQCTLIYYTSGMSNARHSTLYFYGPLHARIIGQLNENKKQKKYSFH